MHEPTHAWRDRREIGNTYLDKLFHCQYQFSDLWKAKYFNRNSFMLVVVVITYDQFDQLAVFIAYTHFPPNFLWNKSSHANCVTSFRPHWFLQALSLPCSSYCKVLTLIRLTSERPCQDWGGGLRKPPPCYLGSGANFCSKIMFP